jgi:hypothetical protein
MKKVLIFITLFSTILLAGCSRISSADNPSGVNGCIPPITNFAYPVGDSNLPAPVPQDVLPLNPWKIVSTLPNYLVKENGNSFESELLRKNGDHEEFWVIPEGGLGVYFINLETKEWKHIEKVNDSIKKSVLFRDKYNSTWAFKGISGNDPLLLHFNEQSKDFEPISDQEGLLSRNVENLSIANLKIDESGIFWMVILNNDFKNDPHRYLLYSFNPKTLKSENNNLGIDFDGELEIGPKNIIYLLNSKKRVVIAYNPQNKLINTYKILSNLDPSNGYDLFFDNQNRLWISDMGWFDFSRNTDNPQWFEIVRPSIFLTYIVSGGVWRWGNPGFMFVSSDGLLWFSSTNGTGWLDPSKGKWCIFTSYSTNVFEDSNNNLWVFVNNTLYEKIK